MSTTYYSFNLVCTLVKRYKYGDDLDYMYYYSIHIKLPTVFIVLFGISRVK